MTAAITVDTKELPLVRVAFAGAPAEDDAARYYATLNEVSARRPRVAHLVDFRALDPFAMTAAARQALARAFFDGIDGRRAVTVCEARIVDDALTRGIIVAFDWVTGAKWPCASFPTEAEAVAWVNGQMAEDAQVSKARKPTSSGVFAISAMPAESHAPEERKAV